MRFFCQKRIKTLIHMCSHLIQVLVQHESKFGDYSCRAKNELGQMNRTMTLYKGQKPPPPVLEEELATPDAVKIRVKPGPSGIDRTKDPAADEERKKGKLLPIIGYVVQYKMATRGDWTTANVTKYDGGKSKNQSNYSQLNSYILITPKV